MSEKEDTNKISKELETDGWIIYWNSKNNYDWPVFNTRGKQNRLDMVAQNYTTTIGLEIKPATSAHIRKGSKIINYCIDYIKKDIQYCIDGVQTTIHKFLLATKYSMSGKLHEDDHTYKPVSKGMQIGIDLGILPQKEYVQTYETVRTIWERFGENFEGPFKPEIGILLSGILDNKEPIPYSQTEYYNLKHKTRIQRWKPLRRIF